VPKINQQLLHRLEATLGISTRGVYGRIAKRASETMLDRNLAALLLASENGINIHKYSTPNERAEIRGAIAQAAEPGARPVANDGVPPSAVRGAIPRRARKLSRAGDNSVFVVHGRNDTLRRSLFDFLRALGLKPLEWEKAVLMTKKTNPYIGEILDNAMARVQAVVVLLSPDDEARLKPELLRKSDGRTGKQLLGQPRANVLFEAGLALGRHPNKTVLVEIGKLRKFSDIAGKHIVRLANDYATRNDFANRLEGLGCKVDRRGTDWTTAGDLQV